MGIRSTIISRIAAIYFALFLFGGIVVFKMISVQQINTEKWEQIANNLNKNTIIVEPNRGNIYADDGSVLATSVPGYFVRIDLAADGIIQKHKKDPQLFDKNLDTLAIQLSGMFGDASRWEYKQGLKTAFNKKIRGYKLTPRKVDYNELQKIKKFHILKDGQFGGGLIVEQENQRVKPLGVLASRTVGGLNKGAFGGKQGPIGFIGLEGAYEQYLKGKNGISYKQNVSGRWVTRPEIEPENGLDVITTLNVKMQDITQNALYNQLKITDADWGTAILMEVETGHVKAIANLTKSNNDYFENDNYALGARGCYEPGSTFKLMSLIAALEDGGVDTSDVFDTGNGQWARNGRIITDTHGYGKLTVKEIFEKSSNIGTAKVITTLFENRKKDYVDRIYSFGINKPLGLEFDGEGQPRIKYPTDSDWWGTTLASMSYGYDSRMTPLQILTFYNAVANNGKMVKPQFVTEIRDNGALVKKLNSEIINPMIASKETLGKAQKMLEGVCERGTGKLLQNDLFPIAGKTGTARIATDNSGYQKGMYQASFVGYFPADNPKYSMMVAINNPRNGYYGSSVSGPVFREVALKVYATQMTKNTNDSDENQNERIFPEIKKGKTSDILVVAETLKLKNISGEPKSELANIQKESDKIQLVEEIVPAEFIPDVRGMGAKDAIYLLENAGLNVKLSGLGKVQKQSISPGTKIKKGQTVYLSLG